MKISTVTCNPHAYATFTPFLTDLCINDVQTLAQPFVHQADGQAAKMTAEPYQVFDGISHKELKGFKSNTFPPTALFCYHDLHVLQSVTALTANQV